MELRYELVEKARDEIMEDLQLLNAVAKSPNVNKIELRYGVIVKIRPLMDGNVSRELMGGKNY